MKNRHLAISICLLGCLGLAQTAQAAAGSTDRQMKRLYEMAAHPERSGNPNRVWIMDGFRDVEVDRFLSSQFGNIQNVMFTGVIVTDKQGQPMRDSETGRLLIEDDGC